VTSLRLLTSALAYWIAFGPHGPRAETPKGEGWKVFSKVVQLVAVSVAVFYFTRLFAKPPPRTLTKEWQEASNEYAKVRQDLWSSLPIVSHRADHCLFINRKRRLNPLPGSAARPTRVLVTFRARPPNLHKYDQERMEWTDKVGSRTCPSSRRYLRYLEAGCCGRLTLLFPLLSF
jgi:hypothetical protein